MGFISLSHEDQSGPSDLSRVSTHLGDNHVRRFLQLLGAASEDEHFELDDILPESPSLELRSPKTAIIATVIETSSQPVILPFIHEELDESIEKVLSTAFETSIKNHHSKVHIVMHDWQNQFRLCAVAWRKHLSFSAIPLSSLQSQSREYDELLRDVKDMLWETEPSSEFTLHVIVRLRGGAGLGIQGVNLAHFRSSQADLGFALRRQSTNQGVCPSFSSPVCPSFVKTQASHGSPMETLCSLSDVRDAHASSTGSLYPHEGIVIRPFLIRKVTFQAEKDGTCTVTFKSHVSPSPAPVEVEGHGGVEGALPTAQIGGRISIRRKENITMRGDVALNKILADMRKYIKIRHWFLSCLIRGTILVKTSSPFDGFIPGLVKRTNRGIELPEPFPLYYFEVVGGAIATVGSVVIFKNYDQGDVHQVKTISTDGKMIIGDKFSHRLDSIAYYWEPRELCVGEKSDSTLSLAEIGYLQ